MGQAESSGGGPSGRSSGGRSSDGGSSSGSSSGGSLSRGSSGGGSSQIKNAEHKDQISSHGSSGGGSSQIKNAEHRDQMMRIVKGEIGPQNLTEKEAIKMFHTVENRMEHPNIKSSIESKQEYQTLKYPNQDYKLSENNSKY